MNSESPLMSQVHVVQGMLLRFGVFFLFFVTLNSEFRSMTVYTLQRESGGCCSAPYLTPKKRGNITRHRQLTIPRSHKTYYCANGSAFRSTTASIKVPLESRDVSTK